MKITVTQDDIEHGVRGSYRFCPIAAALNRNGEYNVKVYQDTIWMGDREYRICSDVILSFIAAFDAKESVKPIEFYTQTDLAEIVV